MTGEPFYLMETREENIRLEKKTDPASVRRQALWCGVKPGLRVLDAGCGPGTTTAILRDLILPEGEIVGVDYIENRIRYAKERYQGIEGMHFSIHDLRNPMTGYGQFDLIWVRFVLEYHRKKSQTIIQNLKDCLAPGGTLCLLDLDHNCLNHYELTDAMDTCLKRLMAHMEAIYDFDPFAGRKLYAYLYDAGFTDIGIEVLAHHLFYGDSIKDRDVFNWLKKGEVASERSKGLFQAYPGGHEAFFRDFEAFLMHPRRFTYTPLIMARGTKT